MDQLSSSVALYNPFRVQLDRETYIDPDFELGDQFIRPVDMSNVQNEVEVRLGYNVF